MLVQEQVEVAGVGTARLVQDGVGWQVPCIDLRGVVLLASQSSPSFPL